MATSGSKSVAVTSYDTLKFSWERTGYSTADNTSTISWKMELIAIANGAISSSASKSWSVTVDGKTWSGTNTVGISSNSTKTLASGSKVITHNSDGTKTFSYSFSQAFNITFGGSSIKTKSGSGSGELTAIARAATITSAPNFTDDENPTITYSNPAGSTVTALKACISFDGTADNITYRDISKTGTSYTFSLTEAERNILRNGTTTSNSRTVKFYIRTTIGGTNYHSSVSKTLTIANPKPTLNPTVTDIGEISTQLTGKASSTVIKNFNRMAITFGASAVKGASIVSKKVVCGSKNRTSDGNLDYVDSGTFTFSVTDSRGNTTTKTVTKTLINYTKVTCNIVNTSFTTDGKISFTINGAYWHGNFGAVNNSLDVKYQLYEQGGSGSWITTSPTISTSNNTYSVNISVSGLDYRKKYSLVAYAADQCYRWANDDAVYTPITTLSCIPVFDWGENDFNFNVPVAINNVELDYVLEQGTNNGWFYRKWNSGLAECWCTTSVSGIDVGEYNLDGMYYSGSKGVNFPFTFTSVNYVNATGGSTGNMNFVRPFNHTNSNMTYVVMGMADKSNVTVRVNLEAKGRWK